MTKFLAGIQETGADEWSLNRHVNRLTGIREIPLVTENEQHFFFRSFCRVPSGV